MRAIVLCLSLAACTPEIVSGAYVCGPNGTCPEGLTCNGTEDESSGLLAETCVLPSLARPFACTPEATDEPNNTAAEGFLLQNVGCVSAPFVIDSCMLSGDTADWTTFVAPSVCASVEVQARLTFPQAFQELGIELWDVDHDMKLATDGECAQGADTGAVRRCLDLTLVPGTKYGVKVRPTGNGTCNGSCAYNRYTLSVQLATPG